MIDISVYIVLASLSLFAVGLNVLSLPGNWAILLAAAGMTLWHHGHYPHWVFLIVIFLILLAAEAVEFAGGMVGARAFGASKLASWAAIAGAVVGGLIGIPPVTAAVLGLDHLLMALVGAFAAAWIIELADGRGLWPATKGAFGAALGRGAGIVAKIGAGLMAWVVFAVAYWLPF